MKTAPKRYSRTTEKENFKKVTPETMGLSSSKNRKWYPTVTFNLKDIPEASNWEVGQKYELCIIAEMRSISKRKDYETDEDKSEATFEIQQVEVDQPENEVEAPSPKRTVRSK